MKQSIGTGVRASEIAAWTRGFAAAAGLLTVGAALCGLAPAASAQQVRNFQCIATSVQQQASGGAPHVTVYITPPVPMEAGQRSVLSAAWDRYVRETYKTSQPGMALCQPLPANAETQERAMAAQESAWARQGWEIVRVNWRPGPAGSSGSAGSSAASIYGAAGAPPAAAAPKAEAASSKEPEPSAAYCYSDDKKPTVYFSDAFDTTGVASSKVYSAAFSKMLAEKYAYKGTVACKSSATILTTNHLILEHKDGLAGKQIVETDWAFDASSAPASAAPTAGAAPAKNAAAAKASKPTAPTTAKPN